MNQVIFLDYYHPYAGLCNQLYLITNHIVDAYQKDTQIYINKVNIDIFNKERIPAEDFFDLKATNENIKRLTGKDLILFEKPQQNFVIPRLCIYPVASIPILNCLEFNEKFYQNIPKMNYNSIHFRLELDAIISYLFDKNCYNDFMDRCNNGTLSKNFCDNFMNLQEVKDYINYLLNQYISFINQIGFENPWYICTLIGKKKIHDCLKPALKNLTDFINKRGLVLKNEQHFEQRELNALVDLLILRDAKCMIGFEGSSYSEGYAFKVNSVRKVNYVKEKNGITYRFVNGIVNKFSDELYKSC